MLAQFRGLVLGELPWGENDKLLSVLTAEAGKVSVLLKGGASLKNKAGAACMPLCYSEFVTADRGGRPWVREATEIESFMNVRCNLELTSTALYMCDVASEVCVENGDESEMLQLMLNTLYALDRGLKDRRLIKAAFEMRTAAVAGFSPDLVSCTECGSDTSEIMYLDVMDGVIHCAECRRKNNLEKAREGHTAMLFTLDRPILDAMRYVCYSNAKRYLSFELPRDAAGVFCEYCERYLINHIDKSFRSLEFLRSLELLPKNEP
ncbi:MAG: DNA repair protein RecO [Clostridia bacterium]|nr:DNA repair protein RecO [Clostridia bacterium]